MCHDRPWHQGFRSEQGQHDGALVERAQPVVKKDSQDAVSTITNENPAVDGVCGCRVTTWGEQRECLSEEVTLMLRPER